MREMLGHIENSITVKVFEIMPTYDGVLTPRVCVLWDPNGLNWPLPSYGPELKSSTCVLCLEWRLWSLIIILTPLRVKFPNKNTLRIHFKQWNILGLVGILIYSIIYQLVMMVVLWFICPIGNMLLAATNFTYILQILTTNLHPQSIHL